jgi:type II secretory pathway component PulC
MIPVAIRPKFAFVAPVVIVFAAAMGAQRASEDRFEQRAVRDLVASRPIYPPPSAAINQVATAVQPLTSTHFIIKRALFDSVLSSPSWVVQSARVVPFIGSGRPSGFKLYAIRVGSVLAAIGVHNGDVILSINGMEISSVDNALEVYTKLHAVSSFQVAILRRGAHVDLQYELID